MAGIIPFKGILYNREMIKNLEDVITPPDDVIPKEDYKKYYQKHHNNIIHIILGKDYPHDSNKYNKFTRAAEHFNQWIKEGILERDGRPSLYVYHQKYRIKGGKEKTRKGFIALIKLEDYKKGIVFPHEETFSKTKKSLMFLKKACRANLSPIFSLYSEPENKINNIIEEEIAKKPPFINVFDNNATEHLMWRYSDPAGTETIKELMSDKKVIIADGHHRYETALALRNILRRKKGAADGPRPHDYVMMYLTNMDDKGLSILPTHRIVTKPKTMEMRFFMKSLKSSFNIETFDRNEKKEFFKSLKKKGKEGKAFGLFSGDQNFYLLTLKDQTVMEHYRDNSRPAEWWNLDVTILQKALIEDMLGLKKSDEESIFYTHDEDEAVRRVEEGGDSLALFLNQTKIKDLQKIVSLGAKMPQKSTFFFPKLLTGLVINKFE